ncbi:hypothetical protein [Labrys sp. ZIDIC5]|uniref:hypothetical protein n=1 Tax=Labrys sedimenti TaxID=3106036 RepID=UPI002ACA2C90|nr:hypothetical protein [Labrys sp. ZIDIC5]MDZ5453895.1 hypothetical protein [Labrys sp. ZIDIC5]
MTTAAASAPTHWSWAIIVGVVTFLSGIGGNLATEYFKTTAEANADVMKVEIVEVRSKISATIDGSNVPKSEQDCTKAIEILTSYLDIYTSDAARSIIRLGIARLENVRLAMSNAQSEAKIADIFAKLRTAAESQPGKKVCEGGICFETLDSKQYKDLLDGLTKTQIDKKNQANTDLMDTMKTLQKGEF